jgi:hypothetical protein
VGADGMRRGTPGPRLRRRAPARRQLAGSDIADSGVTGLAPSGLARRAPRGTRIRPVTGSSADDVLSSARCLEFA